MSFLLPKLTSKKEVDQAIQSTAEKVLVLRFGRDEDPVCLQLDDILSKTSSDLSKMAAIYLVDVDRTPVYTHYFDISYIPSTVFFFNGQHMKVDYGDKACPSRREGGACMEEGEHVQRGRRSKKVHRRPRACSESCTEFRGPEARGLAQEGRWCCWGGSQRRQVNGENAKGFLLNSPEAT
ncbi:thioredoxin-like protein 4B isoform X1 [Mustela lutreola]|uniref:thioredoxin-like protein 4B isoform X1 n=2 Tax=Mustela lutreola TaxID=9666 RepID=UPI0027978E11|nr:thioredoxin-like protein 4B isoform X1 [Mustela lutreola]